MRPGDYWHDPLRSYEHVIRKLWVKESAKRVSLIQTLQRLNEQTVKSVARAPATQEMLAQRVESKAKQHRAIDDGQAGDLHPQPQMLIISGKEQPGCKADERGEVRGAGDANAPLNKT